MPLDEQVKFPYYGLTSRSFYILLNTYLTCLLFILLSDKYCLSEGAIAGWVTSINSFIIHSPFEMPLLEFIFGLTGKGNGRT